MLKYYLLIFKKRKEVLSQTQQQLTNHHIRPTTTTKKSQLWTLGFNQWNFIQNIPPQFPPETSVSSAKSLSHVRLFATPGTAVRQTSLSITNSQSLLKLMCIESVMPSNRLILCLPSFFSCQSSHPPPVFNLSQHQCLFQWLSTSHQVAKVMEWIFRTDFL